jgi:hypothetical protein
MKKRLFLHIGSHKTATTFLQNSFANNPVALAELGIQYPQSGMIYQAHFKLSGELRDRAHTERPLEFLPEWAAALAEIDASPLPIALISSEDFSWVDPQRLAVLTDRFEVQIIFYLRSPDSHLESYYNQLVKDYQTRETRTIETYMAEETLAFLDTSKLLRPWAQVFGDAAVNLRLFDKSSLPDGIMPDFLSVLGAKRVPVFRAPDASILHKVSLPPDALEYLRLSNPWLVRQAGHHEFVLRLIRIAQGQKDSLQETRSGLLSLRARQMLRARFRHSQTTAAKLYLGAERVPFPSADAPPPPTDFEQRRPEADARVMGKVAALLRNEN